MAEKINDIEQQKIDYFENALATGGGSSHEQSSQLNFLIWGSVAIVTKAFGFIEVRVEPSAYMVIVKIKFRWFGKLNLRWLHLKGFMDWQRKQWKNEAIGNCKQYIPNGYRLMLYYEMKNGKFL